LVAIQSYLRVGTISNSRTQAAILAVESNQEIPVIINHFNQYPLVTHKVSDYLIFQQCFDIIKQGGHLTEKGLLEIVSLKSSLNLGLPDRLKTYFLKSSLELKGRPEYLFKSIPDPFWLSGFASGDGSFHIVFKKSDNNINSGVLARFSIHLHVRERAVLEGIVNYLKLSKTEGKKVSNLENSVNLQISKFSDIANIVIPFF
jgi:hypothetical protein